MLVPSSLNVETFFDNLSKLSKVIPNVGRDSFPLSKTVLLTK